MKNLFKRENRQQLFIIIFSIALLNATLLYAINYKIYKIDFSDFFIGAFISMPLLSFLISLLISIIPNNKISYKKRLIQITLISLFIIESLSLVAIFIGHIIPRLFGQYR